MVFTLLLILTNCGVKRVPRLDILPPVPLRGYVFKPCIHEGRSYPCLDMLNAREYVDYLEQVDTYIGMVESLKEKD